MLQRRTGRWTRIQRRTKSRTRWAWQREREVLNETKLPADAYWIWHDMKLISVPNTLAVECYSLGRSQSLYKFSYIQSRLFSTCDSTKPFASKTSSHHVSSLMISIPSTSVTKELIKMIVNADNFTCSCCKLKYFMLNMVRTIITFKTTY